MGTAVARSAVNHSTCSTANRGRVVTNTTPGTAITGSAVNKKTFGTAITRRIANLKTIGTSTHRTYVNKIAKRWQHKQRGRHAEGARKVGIAHDEGYCGKPSSGSSAEGAPKARISGF